jgi:DNA-directed RNA polymerase specialized sigma24 family protein
LGQDLRDGEPVGYLYRVGYDRARRSVGRTYRLPPVDVELQPCIEPGLPDAFVSLPERQRIVVALLHSYQWSTSEVAGHLAISQSTVQTHPRRGLDRLRKELGVEL